jgi:hypothetical protein
MRGFTQNRSSRVIVSSRLLKRGKDRLLTRADQKRTCVLATSYRAVTVRERSQRRLFQRPVSSGQARALAMVRTALSVAVILPGPYVFAQDSPSPDQENHSWSYGVETDFKSNYVWRGIVVNEGPVMQASAWISRSGLTFIAWSNLDPANQSETAHLTYARDWGKLRIEPSVQPYLNGSPVGVEYPNTMQAAAKLSYRAGPFCGFVLHAFDVMADRGSYFGEAGLAYEGRTTTNTVLAVSLHVGWAPSKFNKVKIGLDKGSVNFVGADSSLTYYLRRHLYFRPQVQFTSISDRQLRPYLSLPTVISGGLSMGVEV